MDQIENSFRKELFEWLDKPFSELANDNNYIALIGNSPLKRIEDDYYAANKENGIDIVFDINEIARSIHLFPEYLGKIPHRVNFGMSRNDIKDILGVPTHSGGGYVDLLMGPVPAWDKYYLDGYTMHFQYSENEKSIDLITFGSISDEPYFLKNSN